MFMSRRNAIMVHVLVIGNVLSAKNRHMYNKCIIYVTPYCIKQSTNICNVLNFEIEF